MRASWLTSEASAFTTRPAKLPIEAVPTAFAKDGIIDDENAVLCGLDHAAHKSLYSCQTMFGAAPRFSHDGRRQSARLWPGNIRSALFGF